MAAVCSAKGATDVGVQLSNSLGGEVVEVDLVAERREDRRNEPSRGVARLVLQRSQSGACCMCVDDVQAWWPLRQ